MGDIKSDDVADRSPQSADATEEVQLDELLYSDATCYEKPPDTPQMSIRISFCRLSDPSQTSTI